MADNLKEAREKAVEELRQHVCFCEDNKTECADFENLAEEACANHMRDVQKILTQHEAEVKKQVLGEARIKIEEMGKETPPNEIYLINKNVVLGVLRNG